VRRTPSAFATVSYIERRGRERPSLAKTTSLLLWARVRQVLLLAVVALASPVVCAAPQLFVDLHYRPDPALAECPSADAFRAMISEQLGYDPFRAGAEQTVVARARAVEHGLQGLVEWFDASGNPRGERELGSESTDCAALARAMSFAIAVQIQLLAQEAQSRAGLPPEGASMDDDADATRATAPPVVADPPRDARRSIDASPSEERTPRQFMLGAGPTLAFGLAPRTAVEGRVFGGLLHGPLALELGAEASLQSRYETANGAGFDQHVLAGSVAGCALLGALSACLVSKVGRLSIRGFGVDVPNEASGTLAQIGPRLSFLGNFSERWLGALRVEALVTLASWEVTLNQREVWRTPLFCLTVGGDVAFLFE
jgi:hypothetical protein